MSRLGLVFCHFSAKDVLRYNVLCHRVKLAGRIGMTSSLALDIDQVRAGCVLGLSEHLCGWPKIGVGCSLK